MIIYSLENRLSTGKIALHCIISYKGLYDTNWIIIKTWPGHLSASFCTQVQSTVSAEVHGNAVIYCSSYQYTDNSLNSSDSNIIKDSSINKFRQF